MFEEPVVCWEVECSPIFFCLEDGLPSTKNNSMLVVISRRCDNLSHIWYMVFALVVVCRVYVAVVVITTVGVWVYE